MTDDLALLMALLMAYCMTHGLHLALKPENGERFRIIASQQKDYDSYPISMTVLQSITSGSQLQRDHDQGLLYPSIKCPLRQTCLSRDSNPDRQIHRWALYQRANQPDINLPIRNLYTRKYVQEVVQHVWFQIFHFWTYNGHFQQKTDIFLGAESNLFIYKIVEYIFFLKHLQGLWHEIFDLRFFSQISFPRAPEYSIRAISNFGENSLRNWMCQ